MASDVKKSMTLARGLFVGLVLLFSAVLVWTGIVLMAGYSGVNGDKGLAYLGFVLEIIGLTFFGIECKKHNI